MTSIRGQTFRSDQPSSYYVLLLRSSSILPLKLTGSECDNQLKAIVGSGAVPDKLEQLPTLPVLADKADDPGVDGDDAPIALQDLDSSSSSSTSSSSSSCPAGEVDGDDADQPDLPSLIGGCPVWREAHHRRSDEGLRVQCPRHQGCKRFRSLKMDVHLFGPSAAVHYLEVWLAKAGELSRERHKHYKPSRVEIREHIANSMRE